MQVNKTAIISPSGKFYGSEQTLFSFLAETDRIYDVYVNTVDGQFIQHLEKKGKHRVLPFSNVKLLFISLFIKLLFSKYNCIYVNEGGYIRYVKILAQFFKNVKFVIHIRLTEDTVAKRTGNLPPNIVLISVTRFIAELIKKETGKETVIISSPVRGQMNGTITQQEWDDIYPVKAAVVGRVTDSKGLNNIVFFCDHVESLGKKNLEVHFYGDVETKKNSVSAFVAKTKEYKFLKVFFHGYVKSKEEIYNTVDVVMHFNAAEPLGVIFFEALTFGKPFIGFNAGGIGEIAQAIGLSEYMVNEQNGWAADMYANMLAAVKNPPAYNLARTRMDSIYSVKTYCEKIEKIIVR